VAELLAPALPVSLALGGSALLLALVVGVGLGVRAGLRPNSASDHASMGLALLGISLPNFVIGAGLVIVFALRLGWLPVAGWGGAASAVLPSVTLGLPYAAVIAPARAPRHDRGDAAGLRAHRARRRLPERQVVWKHALRPACCRWSRTSGRSGRDLTGSFVVETLFGVPAWAVVREGRHQPRLPGRARHGAVLLGLVSLFSLAVDLATRGSTRVPRSGHGMSADARRVTGLAARRGGGCAGNRARWRARCCCSRSPAPASCCLCSWRSTRPPRSPRCATRRLRPRTGSAPTRSGATCSRAC
jgi:hypothetical protein